MIEQLPFTFIPEPPEQDEIEMLIAQLRGRDWRTARDLGALAEKDRRKLRQIAEASEGRIISGQQGYKLAGEATPEEIGGFYRWMVSQGKRMIRRAIRARRIWHVAGESRFSREDAKGRRP